MNEVYRAKDAWAPLYKYRGIDRNFFSILLNKELYFAAPETLNDPHDCQIDIISALKEVLGKIDIHEFEETKRKTILDARNQLASEDLKLVSELQSYTKQWGILSFSAVRDDPLMWSHYANEHYGVCLGFDLTKITKNGALENISTCPVVYSNGNPMHDALNEFKEVYFSSPLRESPLPQALYRLAIKAALSAKSFPWKYEEEFRLVKPESGAVEFEPTGLTELVFGARVSQRDRKTVISLLKMPEWRHVKIYNLVLNSSCPTFEVLPANI